MFNTFVPAVHLAPAAGGQVTAHSDLGDSLVIVLVAMATLCGSLIVLTYLEPKNKALQPPARVPVPPRRPRHITIPGDSESTAPAAVGPPGRHFGRP
jgi:hypothetical protein